MRKEKSFYEECIELGEARDAFIFAVMEGLKPMIIFLNKILLFISKRGKGKWK